MNDSFTPEQQQIISDGIAAAFVAGLIIGAAIATLIAVSL